MNLTTYKKQKPVQKYVLRIRKDIETAIDIIKTKRLRDIYSDRIILIKRFGTMIVDSAFKAIKED